MGDHPVLRRVEHRRRAERVHRTPPAKLAGLLAIGIAGGSC
jgi:hypothetical protein